MSEPPAAKRSRSKADGSRAAEAQGSTDTEAAAADAAAATACDRLHRLYKLKFPAEVPLLLELARKLSPMSPLSAFAAAGVRLVGPFEVLQTKGDEQWLDKELWLWHRFGYDPPEALTVLEAHHQHHHGSKHDDSNGSPHWCYIYESPEELPAFVASHNGLADTKFQPAGDSLTATLLHLAQKAKKDGDRLVKALQALAAEQHLPLEVDRHYKAHLRRAPGKTFSGIGVVCPYDRNTQVGYRPLSVNAKQLRDILQRHVDAHKAGGKPSFEQLDNLIQFANIANDEMDFGHGLELGLNLFNFDTLFRRDAANLLIPTYNLLNRTVFAEICAKHSPYRNRAWSKVKTIMSSAALEEEAAAGDGKSSEAAELKTAVEESSAA